MVSSGTVRFSVVGDDRLSPQSPSSVGRSARERHEVPPGAALGAELWITQAKTLLDECAQHLKGSLNAGYPFRDLYPIEQQTWERDRALIQQVEALLAAAAPVQQAPEPNPLQCQGTPVS
jgi:hypothetical protein